MSGAMIIAEVGVNHDGDLDKARQLIQHAKQCGADAVKFQFFDASKLASEQAPLAEYQKAKIRREGATGQRKMLRELELTIEELRVLEKVAMREGINFLVSVFDSDAIETVKRNLNSGYLKVPSGEINNELLIKAAARGGFKLLISSGMSTLDEVTRAVSWAREAGSSGADVCILHCTSNYPTELVNANLRAIETLKSTLEIEIGYSDHTLGASAALGAIALGATVLEKHITLDTGSTGPDHFASSGPEDFRDYVRQVRELEQALGSSLKTPTESEIPVRELVRKSPYATEQIIEGQIFTGENVALMRPAAGIDASLFTILIGRAALKAYSPGELIRSEEVLDS